MASLHSVGTSLRCTRHGTGCTHAVFVMNYLLGQEAISRELSSRPKFAICNECVVDYLVVDLICHF
jgi:hypothetical protein